jgi:hypothetical protein
VREPSRVEALLQDARDAALFLREFVVQGAWAAVAAMRLTPADAICACGPCFARAAERNAQGNFTVQLQQQHAGKQVEVPTNPEEDDNTAAGCCTRPPVADKMPK